MEKKQEDPSEGFEARIHCVGAGVNPRSLEGSSSARELRKTKTRELTTVGRVRTYWEDETVGTGWQDCAKEAKNVM